MPKTIYITCIDILGEALERIKSTCIVDKSVQNEAEICHKNTRDTQWRLINFKKKITSATRNTPGIMENFDTIHMAIKALHNTKIECRNN